MHGHSANGGRLQKVYSTATLQQIKFFLIKYSMSLEYPQQWVWHSVQYWGRRTSMRLQRLKRQDTLLLLSVVVLQFTSVPWFNRNWNQNHLLKRKNKWILNNIKPIQAASSEIRRGEFGGLKISSRCWQAFKFSRTLH